MEKEAVHSRAPGTFYDDAQLQACNTHPTIAFRACVIPEYTPKSSQGPGNTHRAITSACAFAEGTTESQSRSPGELQNGEAGAKWQEKESQVTFFITTPLGNDHSTDLRDSRKRNILDETFLQNDPAAPIPRHEWRRVEREQL